MRDVLLIGNGLNRCLEKSVSWSELIDELQNSFFDADDSRLSQIIQYDTLICSALSGHTREEILETKSNVFKKLNRESFSEEEAGFLASAIPDGMKYILTTNYDYNLENAFLLTKDQPKKKYVMRNENRASSNRHTVYGNVSFYHIHGELELPKSICLGQIDYTYNLHKILERLEDDGICNGDNENVGFRLRDEIFCDQEQEPRTWAEFFFNSNVFILGLGLDDSELDLWWLLLYRAYLKSSSLKDIPNNKIIYYCLFDDKEPKDLISALKKLHVVVKTLKVTNNNWQDMYKKAINSIASEVANNGIKETLASKETK